MGPHPKRPMAGCRLGRVERRAPSVTVSATADDAGALTAKGQRGRTQFCADDNADMRDYVPRLLRGPVRGASGR